MTHTPTPTAAPRTSRRRRWTLAAAGLAAALSVAGCGTQDNGAAPVAETATEPTVAVSDPWVRATTGTEDPSMSAAFMALDNTGDEDVTLVTASSPVAGRTELHEMATVDGEMAMAQVEGGIPLTAGGGKLLQPGGYHVMLMDLRQDLAPGDEVALTLGFSDGTSMELTAPVKEFTEEEGHYHAPGEEHSHGTDGDKSGEMEGMDDGDTSP